MIAALPPAPPAIEQPAAYQVSFGVVAGVASPGTRRVIVRAGGAVLASRPLAHRRFRLRVALPQREATVTVVTLDRRGRRSATRVRGVLGLPLASAPRRARARLDTLLRSDVRRLTERFGPTSAVYVENLVTGAGAAWNARASFPAASTLKLAIAVTALAQSDLTPAHGSTFDELLRRMLELSDNAAANALERAFGGSTSGGSALVNGLMRSIGLVDTEMYGGYEVEPDAASRARLPAGSIPLRVESQPSWGVGKKTSARDLAALAKGIWLAAGDTGPLRAAQPGFTAADARYVLYRLARVRDHGKLDRELSGVPGLRVLHKAGWIDAARHDTGIVVWPGGAFVAAVLTHRAGGAGVRSDVLAGRVARVALDRFRG